MDNNNNKRVGLEYEPDNKPYLNNKKGFDEDAQQPLVYNPSKMGGDGNQHLRLWKFIIVEEEKEHLIKDEFKRSVQGKGGKMIDDAPIVLGDG